MKQSAAASINVAPVLKRPRIFLGVSYKEDDKGVKEWFEMTLAACGFEVVTAEASEHEELGERIRRKIESCDVSCFVLSRRDKLQDRDQWLPPAWIQGEIGIAYEFRQKFAGFVEEKVDTKGLSRVLRTIPHFQGND